MNTEFLDTGDRIRLTYTDGDKTVELDGVVEKNLPEDKLLYLNCGKRERFIIMVDYSQIKKWETIVRDR